MSTEPTRPALNLEPGEAILKEEHFRNPATDEYEYYGRIEVGKNRICTFDEDCEDAPTIYLDAHNTYNKTFLLPSELADQLEEARRIITENRGRIWQAHQETYRGCGLSYEKACKSADIAMVSIDEYISRTKPQTPNPDGKEHA